MLRDGEKGERRTEKVRDRESELKRWSVRWRAKRASYRVFIKYCVLLQRCWVFYLPLITHAEN